MLNDSKEDVFRQRLIALLTTDKEIQNLIYEITKDISKCSEELADLIAARAVVTVDRNDDYQEDITNLRKLVDELQVIKRKQEEELAEAECQMADLTAECLEMKKECEYREVKLKEVSYKLEDVYAKNDLLKKALEKTQDECNLLSNENEKINGEINKLKNVLDEHIEERNILQAMLKQRFERGAEIYARYQSCREKLPSQVENVVRREGFEAFIVGLAQPDALEQLWEAARDAVLQNHADFEKVLLWDMFTYSMDLINQTVAEPLYEVEQVEKGDAYDMDRHTTVRGSRIQGNVTEIIFPGYRNLHTGRIEPTLIRI